MAPPFRRELIEVFNTSPKLVLVEDVATRGKLIVRGEFGRAGVPTANRRIYSRSLWEREFRRLQEDIANGKVTGELNHPSDGRANMFNTAHLIRGLTLTPEGIVIGEAEILENLPGGAVVAAIYRAGGKVGVSSRGFGSTQVTESGDELVQEDYQLVTFDFVSDPADQYAYPSLVTERSEARFQVPHLESKKMPISNPELEALRKEMSAKLVLSLAEARETERQSVMDALAANPAGAPKAVQAAFRSLFTAAPVVTEATNKELVEERAKNQALAAERDEAVAMAKKASFRYYVVRQLQGQGLEEAAEIEAQLGDVTAFARASDLKDRLTTLLRESEDRRQAVLQEEALFRAAQEARDAERQGFESEIAELRATLNSTLALVEEQTAALHRADALTNTPLAPRARAQMEGARSRADVNRIIEENRPSRVSNDRAAAARARAAYHLGSPVRGQAPLGEERSTAGRGAEQDYQGLGADLSELQALCGISSNN